MLAYDVCVYVVCVCVCVCVRVYVVCVCVPIRLCKFASLGKKCHRVVVVRLYVSVFLDVIV